MPPPVAVGIHALYAQRDLVPGNPYLEGEMQEARAPGAAAAAPTRAPSRRASRRSATRHRIRWTGSRRRPRPARRAGLPQPGSRDVVLLLFERAAHRLQLPAAVPDAVRAALTGFCWHSPGPVGAGFTGADQRGRPGSAGVCRPRPRRVRWPRAHQRGRGSSSGGRCARWRATPRQ